MSSPGQIFEWEGITQPSYWGGQILAETGLKAMSQIVATGANTVTIIPNFFQVSKFSNEVELHLGDPNNPWDNESDTIEQVKQSILAAKDRGLKVVLKPHLETNNRVWRAELAPTDPKAWFASYKAMMVEYAKVAQAAGAEMICVGTEMNSMIDPTKTCSDGKTYTQKWGEIIDAVRAVYSGKVTYAATYDTVQKVGFWDKVDFIGVDAYIPSSTVNDPTVDQIVDAWVKPHFNPWIRDTLHGGKSVVDTYKALSEQYGKQVIFTEVGYKSMDGANKDPGVFGGSGTYDPQEQVDCYEALFKVMENYGGRWLAGSFLWSYYSFENPMVERNVPWTDYTTQWKPANATVTTHYSGPAHTTGLARNGTNVADRLDGGYHNDTLNGAGGNDILWGGAGNDRLNGGPGDDALDGVADKDTAVFSGARANYTIYALGNGRYIVKDARQNGDGTDELRGVEKASFSDQTVDLATAGGTPPESIFSIAAVQAGKPEGGAGATTDFTFKITRSSDVGDTSVKWRVQLPAGAIRANDFAVMTGEVSMATGVTEQTITVKVRGDLLFEADETFTVELYGAGEGSSIGSGNATGTILSDDGDNAPSDIVLDNPAVAELAEAGTLIGTLSAADIDEDEAMSYAIVNPDGRFTIDGNRLLVADGIRLDHEQASSHRVTVRVTDKHGATFSKDLVVHVTNEDPEKTAGSAADDVFYGGGGDDTLGGGAGHDRLFGGAGADLLAGGDGGDILSGGAGRDTLTGGAWSRADPNKDAFLFDVKVTASTYRSHVDTVKDVQFKYDSFYFEDSAFSNGTIARYLAGKNASLDHAITIRKGWFAFDQAKDRDDFFIARKVNAKTYKLLFDADGAGTKQKALEIATITYDKKVGGDISYKDFLFV
ncbi:glycoside hydrolase family 113 [Microvirga sesbaniae]|uniref:glycoside hydrolase family 113 n=1 Tax=Microvirga sesbaniae TaxID=681392 RepID=UPI0021C6EDCE|nr:cadherin domain-containing protein [Microvirga sp. HBU67692]